MVEDFPAEGKIETASFFIQVFQEISPDDVAAQPLFGSLLTGNSYRLCGDINSGNIKSSSGQVAGSIPGTAPLVNSPVWADLSALYHVLEDVGRIIGAPRQLIRGELPLDSVHILANVHL
ncbi:MAG: hypothetical protein GF417_09630 [Candidatus Latescibacteria bacterium]|nr:hypothetical protein [bacterium]MBD3424685.1 hypothetical protein [Candidatus Latescibacterota bacterium]